MLPIGRALDGCGALLHNVETPAIRQILVRFDDRSEA